MAQPRGLRDKVYYSLLVSKWVSGVLVALLTLLADQDPKGYAALPYVQSTITWTKSHTTWAFGLAMYFALANFACKQIGPPWAWSAIKHILDGFQKQIIKGIPGAVIEEHRVTLFKQVGRWNLHWREWRSLKDRSGLSKWPSLKVLWQLKWFKPIARSGHTSQRNIGWFPLYDEETLGEGVIGTVWRTQGVKRIEKLPECPPTDPATRDQTYETYAKKVGVAPAWLQQKESRTRPRSYCGIFIEVKGNPWGVMIIDSRTPEMPVTAEQVELAAIALGKFIEKA